MMIIMILVIMTIMNTMIVIMMIMITSSSIQIPSPFCIWNFVWVQQFKCICVVREAPLKLITQAFAPPARHLHPPPRTETGTLGHLFSGPI